MPCNACELCILLKPCLEQIRLLESGGAVTFWESDSTRVSDCDTIFYGAMQLSYIRLNE